MTATNNDEKISELRTKNEKLCLVAQNYQVDPKHAKDYLAVTIIDKTRPDRIILEAMNKLKKATEKKEVAAYKLQKAREKKEQILAKKRQLKEEIAAKKDALFEMVNQAKDVQNRSLKLTRVIRSDKDSYLKMGAL